MKHEKEESWICVCCTLLHTQPPQAQKTGAELLAYDFLCVCNCVQRSLLVRTLTMV
jgi:hypothetical protein